VESEVLLLGPTRMRLRMLRQQVASFLSSRIRAQLRSELMAISWLDMRSSSRLVDSDSMMRSNRRPNSF
jgi:hypothetical protein